jgi:aminopeptidase YwaD
VFNLDEIGYPPKDRALFVDRDEGGRVRENDAAAAALVERVRTLARSVVKVPTRVDPAEDSDYVPFEAEGYVIAGLYEAGEHYPAYHRTDDTMEKVDFAYVTDMARLTTAVLLNEGGLL